MCKPIQTIQTIWTIYALRLHQGRYYIGKSQNPNKRINDHKIGRGAIWTRKFPPINTLELIPNADPFDEDKITKMYMAKYGIENVRGGTYCQLSLDNNTITHIKRELAHVSNVCYECGQIGHFKKDCVKEQ